MAKKSFAVIGLGDFGRAVVEELVNNDTDVIAIDNNEERVRELAGILPTAFVADSTDEKALNELGIKDVDTAIVAYGRHKEQAVITTVLLKELGVKHIIVRSDDIYYVPIFKKIGATEVITPQKAAGESLANRIGTEDFKDFYKLDSKHSVASVEVRADFKAISLIEANTFKKYKVNIVLISRGDDSFIPTGKDQILAHDLLHVVGTTKDIKAFREKING